MSDLEVVTLRTGAEVPKPIVATVGIVLNALMEHDPISLYEAVMIARDVSHIPFGAAGDTLRRVALLDPNGRMHDATRDVILASTFGESYYLRLVSPYDRAEA